MECVVCPLREGFEGQVRTDGRGDDFTVGWKDIRQPKQFFHLKGKSKQ